MSAKKPTGRRGPKPTGVTMGTNFRLSGEVLTQLDKIAEALTRESGVPHTRTDAVRAATKREYERLFPSAKET